MILIGGLVLLGWTLDIEIAKSIIPGMIAMNPGGTAVAFLLAGVSLWIQAESGSRRLRAVAAACAVGVVLLAVLRLVGYVWAWDGGPDQLLFREKLAAAERLGGLENRMAPNTAAALLMVGAALLLLDARSRRSVLAGQFAALATAMIALLAILGYAYSALALAGIEHFIPMALNTAVALGLIAVGILCAAGPRRHGHRHER